MADFVFEDTVVLDFPKTDLTPIPPGGDPTQYLDAVDWNKICQAVLDLKAAIRSGRYLQLAANHSSVLSEAGVAKIRWNDLTVSLQLSVNGGAFADISSLGPKGDKGDKGDLGDPGIQGPPGATHVIFTLTDSASITINASAGDIFDLATLSQNSTFNNPINTLYDGQKFELRIKSSAVRNLTWDTAFRGSVDTPLPTVTSGGGLLDRFAFERYNATGKWDLVAVNKGF